MPVSASTRPISFLLLLLCLFASVVRGQSRSDPLNDPRHGLEGSVAFNAAPGTGAIIFHVHAETASVKMDRQALLRMINPATLLDVWQTTDHSSDGVFTNVAYGTYDVEISAVGFLSTHLQVTVTSSIHPYEVSVVLQRDPEAINLDVNEGVMSPKVRKDEKRAISLLKSGNLPQAQKKLDSAYEMAPHSPDINFLLGYLYYAKKDFTRASTYLDAAVKLNPRNAQALTLLGRTRLERADYPAARSALEQAILADSENWVPHNLLADAYLRLQDYDKARDEVQVAIAKGNKVAAPAQLTLGQALLGLGQEQEGIQALTTFLEEEPKHPLAAEVRARIDWIRARDSGAVSAQLASANPAPGVDPLAATPDPVLSIKSWQPPGVDDIKPALAAGVTCPVGEVLDQSGNRVQELVDDIARFAAVEDIFHQALDQLGVPIGGETRKYNYVANISELESGYLNIDEYRAAVNLGLSDYPDHIATIGFVTLALVFHPHMRDDFDMTCEGLGDWHGQPSWLVHFRQRDDHPNRLHAYHIGSQVYSVGLKGRAWITADKFQIVRLEAEMIKPMPEIQLLSEHQVVEYGPVSFPKKNTMLWLPKSAEIYFDFRKHRYYRRHSYDHYMLYSVETKEKVKEPKSKTDS